MLRPSIHCSLIDSGNNLRSIDDVLRLIETVDEMDDQLVSKSDNTKKQTRVKKCLSSDFERNTDSHSNKRLKKQQTDNNGNVSNISNMSESDGRTGTKFVFSVVWGKYKPNKKHKEWSGDGFVVINDTNKSILFYDISGKSMGTSRVIKSSNDYIAGKRLVIGDKELELIDEVSLQQFQSKSLFVKQTEQ